MKHIETIEKMIRLLNKVNQTNKVPSDYGTGQILYQSEIHTIEAINNHENVNASELAAILGITNGAINQVTNKLVKKGLIEHYRMNNNKKEVYYRLTSKGKIANTEHSKYHEKTYLNMTQYLDELNPDNIKIINTFLEKVADNWPHE
ncbi:MAG: MarR family transcriptional regulator [Firmicutes bacterium]|nr:MarR family transcriptional regulator [Bacillota bacterium]